MTAECSGQIQSYCTTQTFFQRSLLSRRRRRRKSSCVICHMDSSIMLLQSQVDNILPSLLQPEKILLGFPAVSIFATASRHLPQEKPEHSESQLAEGAGPQEWGRAFIYIYIHISINIYIFWSTLCYFVPSRCNWLLTSVKCLSVNSDIALGYWRHSINSWKGHNLLKGKWRIRGGGVSVCMNSHTEGSKENIAESA